MIFPKVHQSIDRTNMVLKDCSQFCLLSSEEKEVRPSTRAKMENVPN